MRVAQKIAGYSLAERTTSARPAGRKTASSSPWSARSSSRACDRLGYGSALGTKLFDIIEPFRCYAFNKSHAYGYGFVALPNRVSQGELRAGVLQRAADVRQDELDKAAVYLSDCRAMNIDRDGPGCQSLRLRLHSRPHR